MIVLFQQEVVQLPWWWVLLTSIGGVAIGGTLGLMGALPWRSSALAAREALAAKDDELETMRVQRNEAKAALAEKDIQLALRDKDIEVLHAKTDLNGLRLKVETMFHASQERGNDMFRELKEDIEKIQLQQQVALNEHTAKDDNFSKEIRDMLDEIRQQLKTG